MAWIKSYQSLATHRKTLRLKRLLGISRAQAIGMLHLLWWWCLDNASDGDLSVIDIEDIAEAMDWSGDPRTIIGALTNSGLLDADMHVHDWTDYAGRLIDHRTDNAERNRQYRKRQKELARERNERITSVSRDHHVIPQSRVEKSRVENIRVENIKKEIYKEKVEKNEKKPYGEFQNVFLTDTEHQKLTLKFSSYLLEHIERLSEGIASKGYKYQSHYAALLTWARKDEKTGGQHGINRQNITTKRGQVITDPTQFTRPEDY